MKNHLIIPVLILTFACSTEPTKTDEVEISVEQVSNPSDLLFGEAEDLFIKGKRVEAGQKLSFGIVELKKELINTAGVTAQRRDSICFFLEELADKIEDSNEDVSEPELVSALYRAQLMTAHDYIVFSARHISNNELDSAEVSIIHATNKMINSIGKAEGQSKTTLQVIHSDTETVLNKLDNRFQRDVTQIRYKLEDVKRKLKELVEGI